MSHIVEMTIRNEVYGGKATILRCRKCLRTIPGKRIVYDGVANEKPAIIKIFLSRLHGKRHFNRELNGFKELAARGVQTAKVLATGKNSKKQSILVLEKVENAVDVFDLLQSADNTLDSQPALKAVFASIAAMHAEGVKQRDLHFGNFLWDGETVYALDPAEMSFSDGPLNMAASMQQLLILLTSLPESALINRDCLLETYYQERKWDLDPAVTKKIESLVIKKRLRSIGRVLRKSLRTSKRYLKKEMVPYTGVFARDLFADQDINAFMISLDRQMEAGEILKRGNTCFVSRIQFNGYDTVVKRYNHKGLWHSLRHTLKGSRAKKCWLFGHRLCGFGIATAQPLAFLEQRTCGLLRQSYILNEFVDGPGLYEVINGDKSSEQQTKDIISKSEKLLEKLCRFRMTHGDMKPGNLLVYHGEPVLIDLDSMRHHRCPWTLNFYTKKMLRFFRLRLHGKKAYRKMLFDQA